MRLSRGDIKFINTISAQMIGDLKVIPGLNIKGKKILKSGIGDLMQVTIVFGDEKNGVEYEHLFLVLANKEIGRTANGEALYQIDCSRYTIGGIGDGNLAVPEIIYDIILANPESTKLLEIGVQSSNIDYVSGTTQIIIPDMDVNAKNAGVDVDQFKNNFEPVLDWLKGVAKSDKRIDSDLETCAVETDTNDKTKKTSVLKAKIATGYSDSPFLERLKKQFGDAQFLADAQRRRAEYQLANRAERLRLTEEINEEINEEMVQENQRREMDSRRNSLEDHFDPEPIG